jgi:hypothetical protein
VLVHGFYATGVLHFRPSVACKTLAALVCSSPASCSLCMHRLDGRGDGIGVVDIPEDRGGGFKPTFRIIRLHSICSLSILWSRYDTNKMPKCTRKGCGKSFEDSDNAEGSCRYHPGGPVSLMTNSTN